jgi:UDP-2,3-diacylglucosamine pyrophosphatase LpxH
MLVIISDLHLCDGTASRNVSPNAFGVLLDDVYDLARQYRARSIELLFLGDVFDFLRTERWFELPADARPWGSPDALDGAPPDRRALDHALSITDDVIKFNADALSALRGEDRDDAPCPVRRLFIPGNHDRLYLVDERIRARVRAALGTDDERALAGEGVTQHALALPGYGVLARHGHEWDVWNFERYDKARAAADYRDEDYLPTPIGDPITTELVARLPFELKQRLRQTEAFKDPRVLDDVYQRMQRIEDVRPLLASFRWVFFQAGQLHRQLDEEQVEVLGRALRETSRDLVDQFRSLAFYQRWRARHHEPWHVDAAAKLTLVLELIDRFNIGAIAKLLDGFASLAERFDDADPVRAGALREKLAFSDGPRFVVYGHTHDPLQAALHVGATDDLYLNSGTWRKRQFLADDRSGFAGWELFTYLVFVSAKETPDGSDRGGPAFIDWNGTRRV